MSIINFKRERLSNEEQKKLSRQCRNQRMENDGDCVGLTCELGWAKELHPFICAAEREKDAFSEASIRAALGEMIDISSQELPDTVDKDAVRKGIDEATKEFFESTDPLIINGAGLRSNVIDINRGK